MNTDPNVSAAATEFEIYEQFDEAAAAIEKLAESVEAHTSYGAVMQQVCEHAVQAISGAEMAAVTLLEHGIASTVACTDTAAFDVDADQYITGEGPCLESARYQTIVRADSAETTARWPKFAAKSATSPVQSYLSAPIISDGHVGAALNLYSHVDHGFGTLDEAVLKIYIVCIGSVVRCARSSREISAELEGLRIAMKTRAIIEQAKGIIMAVQGLSADDAFEILRQRSQDENIKVIDLSASIVASAGGTKRRR